MKRTRIFDERIISEHIRGADIQHGLEIIIFTAAFLTLRRDCQIQFSLTLFRTLEFKKAARGIMTSPYRIFFFLFIDLGTDFRGILGFLGLSSSKLLQKDWTFS